MVQLIKTIDDFVHESSFINAKNIRFYYRSYVTTIKASTIFIKIQEKIKNDPA